MALLKLPRYVEMPGHVGPITGLGPGQVERFVVLTNFREHVRRSRSLLDAVTLEVDEVTIFTE